jgi:hypothetical protein
MELGEWHIRLFILYIHFSLMCVFSHQTMIISCSHVNMRMLTDLGPWWQKLGSNMRSSI